MCYEICNLIGLRPIEKKIAFEKNPQKINNIIKSAFLISQTSTQEKVNELGTNFKGFHVIRDPRDICVSGYYSHLKTHFVKGWPDLAQYRKELQTLSKKDGLLKEFEYSDFWLQHIATWDYNQENIMEIKMENLTECPFEEWARICSFLGILDNTTTIDSKVGVSYKTKTLVNRALKYKSNSERLRFNKSGINLAALKQLTEHKYSFGNLSNGRKTGEENTNSHYRKGKRGDWINHFEKEHKDYFKERYGDLLIKLGYEQNYDW